MPSIQFKLVSLETKIDSKNNFYRTDDMNEEQIRTDSKNRIDLALYQMANSWRDDSDSLKYKPREVVANKDSSTLDSAYERYIKETQSAYKETVN